MTKIYTLWWSICALLLTSPLFSQDVEHNTIPLDPPTIINFKALADYQLLHPQPKHRHRFVEQGEDREEKHRFQSKIITGDAKKFEVNVTPQTVRTISPSPNITFTGTSDNGTLIPPDIDGAAGENYIMETTNQQFDIYNKSGSLAGVLDISSFFSGENGTNYYDPHVLYDASFKRWIVCSDGFYYNNHGAIFLGISQSSDPTGLWYTYSIDATGNPDDFLDYPQVGFNKNWIVVTGNNFLSNGNETTMIYVFPRPDLYNGSSGTVHTFSDASVFCSTPVATTDTTVETEWMVADWDGSSGGFGYVKLFKVTGTVNNPAYAAGSTIGVNLPWDENTVNAPQLGSTHHIEVNDTRINSPIYIGGSIWFTHSVFLPSFNSTYAAVDWWQIDPANADLLQFGRLEDPTGNVFYYYPCLSVNNAGDALLGYSISSPDMYASAQYSFRSSTDPLNTMQDGYLFQPGLASYYKTFGSGRNRWGDYTGTCTDPSNNSFWTFQEFADSPADTWGTVIANVGGTPCENVPSAGIITSVYSTICPGEATILNLSEYSSGVAGIAIQWQQSVDGNSWSNATGIGNTSPRYQSGELNEATYYRCVVTCTNSGMSDTTAIYLIEIGGVVSVQNDTTCAEGLTDLIVDATGTTTWYLSDTSSIAYHTGDTLSTYISGDSTYYVSTSTVNYLTGGIPSNSIGGGSYYNYTFSAGLVFKALSNFILDTVYVYASSTGLVKVNLVDTATGMVIDSAMTNITSSQVGQKTPIPVQISVAGGSSYHLNATGSTVSDLYRTNSGANYPYVIPGILSITRAINNAAGYYYFFYDWHVKHGCESEMVPVHVHIDTINVTASASEDTICQGSDVTLTGTGATHYQWQPGNLNGTSLTLHPSASTTYTVTGTDAYGCSSTSQVNVTVIDCETGIETVSTQGEIQIYPNPTDGYFDLQFKGMKAGNYTIALSNTLGQKINEQRKNISGTSDVSIDVTTLPPGIYFIRVTSGSHQWMKRLVKE